jgi:lambda family phage tail tape measure protein
MANETVVKVTADASGYTSGLEKAKKSAQDFLLAQDAAAKRTQAAQAAISEAVSNGSEASTRQINKFIQSLTKQADTAGKTRAELLQMQAANLGVASSAQTYIDQIAAASEGSHQFSLNNSAARRELLVLAHEMSQGNWTRFGGSLGVLAERTDALTLLFSAAGLAAISMAAGIAIVAMAAIKGAAEQSRMNEVLFMSGNYAGATAGQMHMLAMSVTATGGSIAAAKDSIYLLAESGKFTADQINLITAASVSMEHITGQAVDVTVGKFVKLAEDPVKASATLNEQYHYLTASVYEQIIALENQGNKQAAANLAEQAYASSLTERAKQLQGNLSAMGGAWATVREAASKAWDAMLGIGRKDTPEEKINKIIDLYKYTLANNPNLAGSDLAKRFREKTIAQLTPLYAEKMAGEQKAETEANKARENTEKVSAITRLEDQRKATRSRADLRTDEINQLKRDANTVGMSSDEYSRRAAAINDKYKDPKGAKPKAYQDDAATMFLQQLRDQDAAIKLALESNEKLTGSEKQLAEFSQKIADLKGKSILTAEQKSLLANQDAIKAQLQINIADEKALKLKTDIQHVEERRAQIAAQISSYQENQNDGYQRQLDAFGMGADAQKQLNDTKAIYKHYQQLQDQLTKDTAPDALGSEAFKKAQEEIKQGLADSLNKYGKYYADLKEKQGDWANGASSAFADYLENARNIAAQTEAAFTHAFKGLEDAMVTFLTTGKLDFKSFATSIMADLDRIIIKQQLASMYQSATSAGPSGDWLRGAMGMLGSLGGGGAAAMGIADGAQAASGFTLAAGMTGLASGGFAGAGSLHEVNERGPELLSYGGRQFLMMNGGSGHVIPNDQHGAGQSGQSDQPININVHVNGNSNAPDVRRAAGQGAREALAAFSGAQRYA